MAPRPYRPLAELEAALVRGDLDFAVILAAEVADERRRPIDLDLALRFLPLIAARRSSEYDAWALRWLQRWIGEAGAATIERAAEVAASLADLPAEPATAVASLRGSAGVTPVLPRRRGG
ncbi:MAG TPA: hypothetical protein VGN08_11525 [Solirubrobacteraceae bacterium]|jgi:hypothetical protein